MGNFTFYTVRGTPDGWNYLKLIVIVRFTHFQLHVDFNEAAVGLREKIRSIESSAKTSEVVMKHIAFQF